MQERCDQADIRTQGLWNDNDQRDDDLRMLMDTPYAIGTLYREDDNHKDDD